jgi:hypothetical protein
MNQFVNPDSETLNCLRYARASPFGPLASAE